MANRTNVSLKLSEAREMTPAPKGIGAWAEKLREAAMSSVEETDMKDIMSSMVKRAKNGDMQAAKFVMQFIGSMGTEGAQKPQNVVIVQNQAADAGDTGLKLAVGHMEESPDDEDDTCDRCGIYKKQEGSKLCRTCERCDAQQKERKGLI